MLQPAPIVDQPIRLVLLESLQPAQPLHHDEAQGIAERIVLVLVGSKEGDSLPLVLGSDPFNVTCSGVKRVEEGQGAITPASGSYTNHGLCW